MPSLLETARPYIRGGATWLLKQSGTLTLSLLEFLLAIVLAGFLCANGAKVKEFLERLICRIAGQQGFALISIAVKRFAPYPWAWLGQHLCRHY